MKETCEHCHEPMDQHRQRVTIDGVVTCYVGDLTIRTQSSVPVAPGTDATPDGDGDLQHRRRAGDHTRNASHYTGDLVISAAMAWADAHTDAEVETACDALTAAVTRYRAASNDLFGVAAAEMVGPGR